jgi:hypothetical protein
MIEWFFFLAIVFIVLVIFYKQANEEFTILQCDGTQLVSLSSLIGEKYPIVVKQIQLPVFYTAEAIQQNKRIQTFPMREAGKTLAEALSDSSLTLSNESGKILAQQIGLQVWAEHNWLPYISSWSFLYSIHSFAFSGERPLRKTTAQTTIVIPTSQPIEIAILTGSQEKFFPETWRERFPETFTVNDTPLVGNIKFIIIKVKPGTVLCIPPHWMYSIRGTEPKKALLWCVLEAHHPLSRISAYFEQSNEN